MHPQINTFRITATSSAINADIYFSKYYLLTKHLYYIYSSIQLLSQEYWISKITSDGLGTLLFNDKKLKIQMHFQITISIREKNWNNFFIDFTQFFLYSFSIVILMEQFVVIDHHFFPANCNITKNKLKRKKIFHLALSI